MDNVYYTHPIHTERHWLPLEFCIQYKLTVLAFHLEDTKPEQSQTDCSGFHLEDTHAPYVSSVLQTSQPHTKWFCVCLCVCVWQNPKILNLSLIANDAITQDSIQGLGSLLYTVIDTDIFNFSPF